jgi:hypothetical protein
MIDEPVDQELLQETSIALWVLRSSMTNPKLSRYFVFYQKRNSSRGAHDHILELLKKEECRKTIF